MPMNIVESFKKKKISDELCEDVIHQSSSFCAIIDGSSIGPMINGVKSGKIIAEAINDALASAPQNGDMEVVTRHINEVVREVFNFHSSHDVNEAGRRPAASVIILSKDRKEIWCYGDTMLQINGEDIDLTKKIDDVTTLARCAAVRALLTQGRSQEDLLRTSEDLQFVQMLLDTQQQSFMNNAQDEVYGYANIDGSDDVISLVRKVPVKEGDIVIMASDGYPKIFSTLAETEAYLKKVIQEDPLMAFTHPSIKGVGYTEGKQNRSFDDRAYVRVMV